MCVRILYKHSQVDQECRVFNNLSTLRQQVHSKRRTLGSYVYSATMYLEKVVPKMCSLDPKGSATSSQGIRGYTSVMATLKFTYVSWIKRYQLDVTCFFISSCNAQHVSDVNTSILRSLRLICWVISWVILLWYDACWCYGVVWLGWCGIRTQASACIRIPHHHNATPTHIVPEQYNPWNNSTNKSQAPEDGCTNIRNMLSIT